MFFQTVGKRACARNSCTFETDLAIRTHLQRSETNYCFVVPPKSSTKSTTASSVPKSPPKARRSTRKRAQSSTSATAEPPAKKIAPSGEGEAEGTSAPKPERGNARRGKANRCVTDDFMIFKFI